MTKEAKLPAWVDDGEPIICELVISTNGTTGAQTAEVSFSGRVAALLRSAHSEGSSGRWCPVQVEGADLGLTEAAPDGEGAPLSDDETLSVPLPFEVDLEDRRYACTMMFGGTLQESSPMFVVISVANVFPPNLAGAE